jgi:hypothetical protein
MTGFKGFLKEFIQQVIYLWSWPKTDFSKEPETAFPSKKKTWWLSAVLFLLLFLWRFILVVALGAGLIWLLFWALCGSGFVLCLVTNYLGGLHNG